MFGLLSMVGNAPIVHGVRVVLNSVLINDMVKWPRPLG